MKPIHHAALVLTSLLLACEGGAPPGDSASTPAQTQSTDEALRSHVKQTSRRHGFEHKGLEFARTDLVSDLPGANNTDPTLLNAWGLAFNPGGLAWVAANGSGISEIYNSEGGIVAPPRIVPPPPGGDTSAPTGQIFNDDPAAFAGDEFIVATEDGTIAGWQKSLGLSFALRVDNSTSGAVYKGIARGSVDGALRLFAADFHNNKIDVFDQSYQPIDGKGFKDHDLPDGFAPFNIVSTGNALIVTYALQDSDAHDDVAGPGNGYVDLFSTNGRLVSRLISQEGLNSPWGVAIAPYDFGRLAGHLLVGNFGDGRISVYDLQEGDDDDDSGLTAEHDGELRDQNGHTLHIDGLWSIAFGVGTLGFNSHAIYFTAGPNHEADGVFGRLDLIDHHHGWK